MMVSLRCAGRLPGVVAITIILTLTGMLPASVPVRAAQTIVVNSLADPGPTVGACPSTCTLRRALAIAQDGDTITFSVGGTILLVDTLAVTRDVSIKGPGPDRLAIDGRGAARVFSIGAVTATLEGLTIQHGNARGEGAPSTGGGIENGGGTVTLKNSVISGNAASFAGGGVHISSGTLNVIDSLVTGNVAVGGGGIFVAGGTVNITNSTLSGNAADNGGGLYLKPSTVNVERSTLSANSALHTVSYIGLKVGGAIANEGSTLTVTNGTLSGNTAVDRGGAIWHVSGSTTISYSTLVDNAASSGGGFWHRNGVTLRNSIVARSPNGGNCFGEVGTILGTVGTNLSDTSQCFGSSPGSNIVAADVGLAPLAVNSPGTTATHALLPGSPAIDGVAGSPSECTSVAPTDQRGVARPQSGAAQCDIGAFEHEHSAPTISEIADQSTGQDGSTPTVPFTVGSTEVPPSSLTVAATSSNQALIPNANIQVSGSGTARAIKVTATPHQSGEAIVEVKVSDGTVEARETFKVTVLAVPSAVNDSYSVAANQALIVPAASGVLQNDADPASSGLQAEVVGGPANGTLDLKPDGGFTYRPAVGFVGTDSFTYRASNGVATSSPATVSIAVTAAPVQPSAPCSPRATVKVTTAVVGGKLQATVEALPLDARTNNRLRSLQFGELQNARVTVNGQPVARGATLTLPADAIRATFTVERVTAGQATTVPITVVDECGAWPSFVGGGAGAGF